MSPICLEYELNTCLKLTEYHENMTWKRSECDTLQLHTCCNISFQSEFFPSLIQIITTFNVVSELWDSITIHSLFALSTPHILLLQIVFLSAFSVPPITLNVKQSAIVVRKIIVGGMGE